MTWYYRLAMIEQRFCTREPFVGLLLSRYPVDKIPDGIVSNRALQSDPESGVVGERLSVRRALLETLAAQLVCRRVHAADVLAGQGRRRSAEELMREAGNRVGDLDLSIVVEVHRVEAGGGRDSEELRRDIGDRIGEIRACRPDWSHRAEKGPRPRTFFYHFPNGRYH